MKQLMKLLESWRSRSKTFKVISIIALVCILYLGLKGIVFAEELELQEAVEEEVVEELVVEPGEAIVGEEAVIEELVAEPEKAAIEEEATIEEETMVEEEIGQEDAEISLDTETIAVEE